MNRGSVRASLASIVLAFEAIVIFLAALVLWGGLTVDGDTPFGLPRWSLLVAGGVVLVLLVTTIALLRHQWAFWLGWAVQGLVFVSGILNPAMFIVGGALFGAMWAYCMVVGARIDREKAAREAAGKEPA